MPVLNRVADFEEDVMLGMQLCNFLEAFEFFAQELVLLFFIQERQVT